MTTLKTFRARGPVLLGPAPEAWRRGGGGEEMASDRIGPAARSGRREGDVGCPVACSAPQPGSPPRSAKFLPSQSISKLGCGPHKSRRYLSPPVRRVCWPSPWQDVGRLEGGVHRRGPDGRGPGPWIHRAEHGKARERRVHGPCGGPQGRVQVLWRRPRARKPRGSDPDGWAQRHWQGLCMACHGSGMADNALCRACSAATEAQGLPRDGKPWTMGWGGGGSILSRAWSGPGSGPCPPPLESRPTPVPTPRSSLPPLTPWHRWPRRPR